MLNPFFHMPEDMLDDSGEPSAMAQKFIEEQVTACWDQLANPQMGGYVAIPQKRGWSVDPCEPRHCPQAGRWFNNDGRLNVTVMRVECPPGHVWFKHGHVTFILRHPDHGRIYFQRIDGVSKQEMWLPDEMAAKLAVEGKFTVLEYDTPEGALLEEQLRNPEVKTLEELQLEEHKASERGSPQILEVPYT